MTRGRMVSWVWRLRLDMPPALRRVSRRSADVLLAPVGSITGFRTTRFVAALSFDDGPDPACTPAILDLLDRERVPATFFVLADRARAFPDLIERMINEGHDVGLHGDEHGRLTSIPSRELRQRLARAKAEVERISAVPVQMFRPPFGLQTPRTYAIVRRLGMDVVGWGAYAEEWIGGSADDLARRMLRRFANLPDLQVILLHDGIGGMGTGADERVAGVKLMIDELRGRGYELDSVSRLVARYGARRTAWFRA